MPSPLGNKIRALRLQLGMSLDQLAEQTNSSKSYVWELENREKKPNPSADKVAKIAAALQVTPQFLMDNLETTPDEVVKDEAFFRKYQQLGEPDKTRLRKLIDAWNDED
jgi:transcriptional regulator with XRE-family HTH domain